MKVILDGEYVEDSVITPKLHKFIGTFREPTPPAYPRQPNHVYMNGCQTCSNPYAGLENCWRLGHWDLPQYVTLKE